MTEQDYFIKLADLQAKLKIEEKKLIKEYVQSNATLKIGQIATDSSGSIEIDLIYGSRINSNHIPVITYYGVILKKDGTPKKNRERRSIYQTALILK